MRKVVASEFVSLDGVMESPDKWHFPYFNDEMGEAIGSAMARADALLLGRVTYEEWAAYWPNQSSDESEISGYMNDTPKYVVSTTLEEPLEWRNSTLIGGTSSRKRAPCSSSDPARTSRSRGVAPSSGRCCVRTSSTSLGSWSILSWWARGNASSRMAAIRRRTSSLT